VFPDRLETHSQIVETAQGEFKKGKIPIFRAYSVGKAQEVIALLQQEGIPVVSGNQVIDRVCKVYNRFGSDLHAMPMTQSTLSEAYDSSCAIVASNPHATYKSVRKLSGTSWLQQKSSVYSLTGWSLGSSDGKSLPLSAHTDFPGLLEFARKVEPRIVYCFTSNAHSLATHLGDVGLTAVPLE
jgi:putative mRNA 3-end processing factor